MKKHLHLAIILFITVLLSNLQPQLVMARRNPYGDEVMKNAPSICYNRLYEDSVSPYTDNNPSDSQHYGDVLYKFKTNSQSNYYKFTVSATDGIIGFLIVNKNGSGFSLDDENGDSIITGSSYVYLEKNTTYYLVVSYYYYTGDETPSYSFLIETSDDTPDEFKDAKKGNFNTTYKESLLTEYDNDWYKFTAKELCNVTLKLYKDNKSNVDWEIYNKKKQSIDCSSFNPATTFQLLPNETVYLRFSGKNTGDITSYRFNLKCTPAKYINEGSSFLLVENGSGYIFFSWHIPKNYSCTKQNASGVQIRYSTQKNMKNPTLVKHNKNATLWPDVGTGVIYPKNMNKTYFFQIRSYLKSGKKKYYSKWSSPIPNTR